MQMMVVRPLFLLLSASFILSANTFTTRAPRISLIRFNNSHLSKPKSIPHELITLRLTKDVKTEKNFPADLTTPLIQTLIDKTFDTVEDASLHFRRLNDEKAEDGAWSKCINDPSNLKDTEKLAQCIALATATADENRGKKTIVVLGSGWGAHAFMKVIDTGLYRVVAVSPRNYFIFTPMLAASSVGTIEYRSITEPIRAANPLTDYIQGEAIGIDINQKTIEIQPTGSNNISATTIPFDALIIAVGTKVADYGIPGVREHTYFLKDISNAASLRRKIVTAFEAAAAPGVQPIEASRLLRFVVVGGGPTGVELAGEIHDFIVDDVSRVFPRLRGLAKIELLQAGDAVLPSFDESLRDFALQKLRERPFVDVRLGTRVVEVLETELVVEVEGSAVRLPYGVCAWTAGVTAIDFTKTLSNTLDEPLDRARLRTDKWLRVKGCPDGSIFSIGDAAVIDNDTAPLPQTAQVAAQQGPYVARLMNRGYDFDNVDQPPTLPDHIAKNPIELSRRRGLVQAKPFDFLNLGALAYLGGGEAVTQFAFGGDTILTASGTTSFLLWRSVYIVKQVAIRNRILVLFDWFKSKVFGRDVTRF